MQTTFATLIIALAATSVQAQQADDKNATRRYGIELRLRDYAQATPKEALASVVRAVEAGRIDYLLAHLTDPKFVDERVKQQYRGDFDQLVKETTTKLKDNPTTLKDLQRYLKEGEWEAVEDTASVRLKEIPDRQVFLRKIGKRWFLENRQKK
jgi:hypothetical protein